MQVPIYIFLPLLNKVHSADRPYPSPAPERSCWHFTVYPRTWNDINQEVVRTAPEHRKSKTNKPIGIDSKQITFRVRSSWRHPLGKTTMGLEVENYMDGNVLHAWLTFLFLLRSKGSRHWNYCDERGCRYQSKNYISHRVHLMNKRLICI